MILFKDYKEQYRSNLRLAAPIMVSHAGQMAVQLADNVMVGRLGAAPLAGVALGGTLFWAVFILCMGVTMGLTPLVGEMFARGNHRTSAYFLQNSIVLYMLIGILTLGVQFSLVPLMHHMGQPPEAVAQAVPYYKYLIWSVLPFMLFAAFKQFLEGLGQTKAIMIVVITANCINVFFNYLLIYGKWGFPQMGAAGSGLATLISRLAMPLLIILFFVAKNRYRRYFSFFSWAGFHLGKTLSLLKVGMPIAMQMFMENGAFVVTAIMMGWIGTAALAANQIGIVIANFSFMMVIGISSATTIRVSHEYGSGNLRRMKMAADSSYHIAMLWNTFIAMVFIVFRNYIPRLFTDDPQVLEIASMLMIFVAAFQLSDGLQAVSIGILRGLQDVKSIMKIAFVSYLVVNLPIGYFCAFVLGWGPGGLWVGYIFGITMAAVLLITRFRWLYRKLLEKGEHY